MIDVHCLTYHECEREPRRGWLEQLRAQMAAEPGICYHEVYNRESIGAGRVKGFSLGGAPLVSYVDCDDLIEPGAFERIEQAMARAGAAWAYGDERLIDEAGTDLQPGWGSAPELYDNRLLEFMQAGDGGYAHHLVVFRRELLTKPVAYILRQLRELPEQYLLSVLRSVEPGLHVAEVGYYWRQHSDNTYRSFEAYRELAGVDYA